MGTLDFGVSILCVRRKTLHMFCEPMFKKKGGKDGAREKGCACRLCRRDELKYPSLMSKYGSVPRGEEQRYFWTGDGGLEVGLGVGK